MDRTHIPFEMESLMSSEKISSQGADTAVTPQDLPRGSQSFITVAPEDCHWQDIPGGLGAQFATVLGSQQKPGLYVVRVRFPPHTMDTPHSHTADRYVTVLEGSWVVGTGSSFDPAAATCLPPGSVMFHPAHGVHWDGSAGDDPVIVQIVGIGPVSTVPADLGEPRWVRVDQGKSHE